MKPETRAAMALVAICRANSINKGQSIYDHDISSYKRISGDITNNKVNLYDYDNSCHISGNNGNLYHYGNSSHISIKMDGNKFSGYDYDSSAHYSGTVTNKTASLYDYETSSYYNFSL